MPWVAPMSDRKLSHLDAWRRSERWRAIARLSGLRNVARWKAKPRCGARRKYDGAPCQNPAMDNGRCTKHGGRTGSGDNFHVRQWPNPKAPDANARLNWKLARAEREEKRRQEKLAAMSPDELAAHKKWQRAHKPGPAIERERIRMERRQNADLRERIERMKAEEQQTPVSPTVAALQTDIAMLRAELDRVRIARELSNAIANSLGVFG